MRKVEAHFRVVTPMTLAEEDCLFTALWDAVSCARDQNSFDGPVDLALDALEAEMAGRALTTRLVMKATA